MDRYVVTIKLGPDNEPFPVVTKMGPDDEPIPVAGRDVNAVVGDRLKFVSPDGKPRIHFVDPVGSEHELPADHNHPLVEQGRFRYQCGLTVGGATFGWPKDQRTDAGGEVIVERPRNT